MKNKENIYCIYKTNNIYLYSESGSESVSVKGNSLFLFLQLTGHLQVAMHGNADFMQEHFFEQSAKENKK